MVSISILISFSPAEELLDNTDNDQNLHSWYLFRLYNLFNKYYANNTL